MYRAASRVYDTKEMVHIVYTANIAAVHYQPTVDALTLANCQAHATSGCTVKAYIAIIVLPDHSPGTLIRYT